MDRKGIDIIIPVYNALDDLKLCIDSINKWTDLSKDRVIIIDDKSPDESILAYLHQIQTNNTVIIENNINKGFSASVNVGMQYSDRDVLLLNSDTVVTRDWVNKIYKCAYREDTIGTVTPLSNAATLCSIPIFCQDNEIPKGLTIDQYAELVEHYSLHKYPQITVAVGFCMFIKRKVINEIGYFDSETFQKGYGEENDFCNRAEQIGYKHIMCDDTFIYHKGTASFEGKEKLALIKEHNDILMKRYEKQMKKNHHYVMTNPDQDIRDNLAVFAALHNNKRNILFLLQSDFCEGADNNIGGTQYHVKDLTYGIKNDCNVFVMSRDLDCLRLTIYCGDEKFAFKFFIGTQMPYPVFFDDKHKKLYFQILNLFHIDVVHIHNTYGLTLDLFYVAKDMGIQIIATLHDYYYICPTIRLLNHESKFCSNNNNLQGCEKCLNEKSGISSSLNYIEKWRNEHKKILEMCDVIITPSDASKRVFANYYPQIIDKIVVIPHGLEIEKPKEIDIKEIEISDKCNICIETFLSGVQREVKGWAYLTGIESSQIQILLEIQQKKRVIAYIDTNKCARFDVSESLNNDKYIMCGFNGNVLELDEGSGKYELRVIVKYGDKYFSNGEKHTFDYGEAKVNKNNFNVAFIGGLNEDKGSKIAYDLIVSNKNKINWFVFGGVDKNLAGLQQNNLIMTGAYKREALLRLIERYNIDVICILPIWGETFCYTLSEALICKKPVIVTDIGAVGERTRKMGCGWIVPMENADKEVINILNRISNKGKEYNEILSRVNNIEIDDIGVMVDKYKKLYQDLKLNMIQYKEFDTKTDADILSKMHNSKLENKILNDASLEELELFKSSNTYRIVTRLINTRIPFKSVIKKILLKNIQ